MHFSPKPARIAAFVAVASVLVAASRAFAQEGSDAVAEDGPPPASLDAARMAAAAVSDAISLPMPGEFFAAMDKTGKTNWQSLYRTAIPSAFPGRAQNALNLGGLIADGYLAIEAEDAQQVKNIGKDVMSMANALGVGEGVVSRGNSIAEFAEQNQWNVLKEELENTQSEVKLALAEQEDADLVALVSVGAWARGLEAVSAWIAKNYSEDAAKLLRQPAVISQLRAELDALPDKVRGDDLVKEVRDRLKAIETMVSFDADSAPAEADVAALAAAAAELGKLIAAKP